MTHTKGPWEVIGGTVIHAEIEEIIVATVPEENAVLRFNETRANARLIAAAPDLLEVLKNLVNNLPEPEIQLARSAWGNTNTGCVLAAREKAIKEVAKAERND